MAESASENAGKGMAGMSSQHELGFSRRGFLQTSAAAMVGSAFAGRSVEAVAFEPRAGAAGTRPTIISSANGIKAIDTAWAMLEKNADPLDAVIAAVNIVEDDPNDHSVGLGGLPNEDGVVELDASVMHGPTHKAGAVAAIQNIRNPSKVARLVMQRTDHVLLVGEGALRFARAHGFKEENLLTDEARKIWLQWKESHSDRDNWLTPGDSSPGVRAEAPSPVMHTWGTINCCAVDRKGDIGGVTTTSGLSYKLPGRVGDSPIIGAGLYVDNEVGAAGSTGRGEANLQNCTSFFIVERMRAGLSPEEACLESLKRVAGHTEPRLRDKQGRPNYGLTVYALAKDGRYGGASFFSGGRFAVRDGRGARLEPCAFLYQRPTTQPAK